MKYTILSNACDICDRSHKDCVCGGHNHKNVKKNMHHHGTKQRLDYHKTRRFMELHKYEVIDFSDVPIVENPHIFMCRCHASIQDIK